jgi:hypothetical protein
MSKKSILGLIATIVVGGIFGGSAFAAGRESKKVDDNNKAADDYMDSVDGTDDTDSTDSTGTDEEDSDE